MIMMIVVVVMVVELLWLLLWLIMMTTKTTAPHICFYHTASATLNDLLTINRAKFIDDTAYKKWKDKIVMKDVPDNDLDNPLALTTTTKSAAATTATISLSGN
ncbi:hypothetical protein HELRODRAFT_174554 [Helobdella robusta]|uniref:Uncharacterized protein n=1 Tax=Helobdella robusta TaxID=6412 RepID=T1F891_HELRO|nr:hypothetical protein HELRODRAFT_174554 [Helobdella robusta]ESO01596.1 hypothetical protein HELRODRAFT_174554 [Helobdella robusta]